MSKITVHAVEVTMSGDPPVPVVPPVFKITVHQAAVVLAGADQTVNTQPVE